MVRMEYTPNPNLSDSERLITIEVMLVNTLKEQESQGRAICLIRRMLWIACGAGTAALVTNFTPVLSALGKV